MTMLVWLMRLATVVLIVLVARGSRVALVVLLARLAIGQEFELRRIERERRDADDWHAHVLRRR